MKLISYLYLFSIANIMSYSIIAMPHGQAKDKNSQASLENWQKVTKKKSKSVHHEEQQKIDICLKEFQLAHSTFSNMNEETTVQQVQANYQQQCIIYDKLEKLRYTEKKVMSRLISIQLALNGILIGHKPRRCLSRRAYRLLKKLKEQKSILR